jgi:hypothetical protein
MAYPVFSGVSLQNPWACQFARAGVIEVVGLQTEQ